VKRIEEVSLKIGKTMVWALLAAQYIFAIWWVIHNITVIPDFALASESYIYGNIVQVMGNFFWLIYLAQVVAFFFGIRELFPNNFWIACFSITNPLILQFVFALVPDIFCVAMLLALLAPILQGEKLRGKHIIFLFILGMLNAAYFFAGIFVIAILVIRDYVKERKKKDIQVDDVKYRKRKLANRLMLLQVALVIILLLVSYQTRKNEKDETSVQIGIQERFTINEEIPSNHSELSVIKGVVTDTLYMVMTPYTYMQVMEQKLLTQNGWNYVNFTRELPRISKYYMELSERNLFFALAITVLTWMGSLIFSKKKFALSMDKIRYILTCFGVCLVFAIVTKRGVDYRTGLFVIPIWYAMILSWFERIKIFSKKEEGKKL
jgi:hypothetical protein